MIQVKEFLKEPDEEYEINEWIRANKNKKIIDIKYSINDIGNYSGALVIYEDNEIKNNNEQNTYNGNSIDNALKAFRDYMSKNYRCIYTILSIEGDRCYKFKIKIDNSSIETFECIYNNKNKLYFVYKVN